MRAFSDIVWEFVPINQYSKFIPETFILISKLFHPSRWQKSWWEIQITFVSLKIPKKKVQKKKSNVKQVLQINPDLISGKS